MIAKQLAARVNGLTMELCNEQQATGLHQICGTSNMIPWAHNGNVPLATKSTSLTVPWAHNRSVQLATCQRG